MKRALVVLVLLAGCGIDTGDAARRDAARALRCPRAQVETEQVGEHRYIGRGCGRNVTVTCTASALEPTCLPPSELTAGNEEDEDARADTDAPPEIERQIRDGLTARREDVLACTGLTRVAVRVTYAPDGSIDLSLQGDLSGSAQQRCVQEALAGVRVAATGGAGVVVHLVR